MTCDVIWHYYNIPHIHEILSRMKLNNYIFKQLLFLTLNFTIVPMVIVWIVQSRDIADLVINNGVSVWLFLKLSFLTLPMLLPHLFPFILLLASIFLIYKLYNDNEITIFWSSGNRTGAVAKPYIQVALIVSAIVLALNLWIAPKSSQTLKEEIFYVKNDLAKAFLKKADFISPMKGIRVYLHDIKAGSEINGFFLEDNSSEGIKRVFTAQKAVIVTEGHVNKLLLLNGRVNIIPTSSHTKASVLDFEKFTLDIGTLSNQSKDDIRLKSKDFTIDQLLSPPEDLPERIKKKFISEGHQNIASAFNPLLYICFFIVGFLYPMAPRRFPVRRIFSVLGCAVMCKVLLSYLANLSEKNLDYVWLIYGIEGFVIIATLIYISILSRKKHAA